MPWGLGEAWQTESHLEKQPQRPRPSSLHQLRTESKCDQNRGRGQLESTYILGTKLDGKTLGGQNQGCPQSVSSILVIHCSPTHLSLQPHLSWLPAMQTPHVPYGVSGPFLSAWNVTLCLTTFVTCSFF